MQEEKKGKIKEGKRWNEKFAKFNYFELKH